MNFAATIIAERNAAAAKANAAEWKAATKRWKSMRKELRNYFLDRPEIDTTYYFVAENIADKLKDLAETDGFTVKLDTPYDGEVCINFELPAEW